MITAFNYLWVINSYFHAVAELIVFHKEHMAYKA